MATKRKVTRRRAPRPLTVAQVREILDYPREGVRLDKLASAAGVTRSTLEAYRSGRLQPSVQVRTRLALYLDQHARRLQALVRRLRP